MKLSFFSYCVDVGIFSLFSFSLLLAILLFTQTSNNGYLAKRYTTNWNLGYIVDLKLTDQDTCTDSDLLSLGVWSGFAKNSCYCEYPGNTFQILEKSCGDLSAGGKCHSLSETQPIKIKKYKGFSFCVKRSQYTMYDIANAFYGDNDVKNKLLTLDDNAYMNYVYQNSQEFQTLPFLAKLIDPKAIIDIRLFDRKIFKSDDIKKLYGINIDEYEEIKMIDTDDSKIFLYLKRLGTLSNLKNLHEINNLIVDIHLFNHLWCGYHDVSVNSLSLNVEDILNPNEVNYGYDYCNRMVEDELAPLSPMFYNDGFKRTQRINAPHYQSASKLDFYTDAILKEVKTFLKSETIPGKLEPILIYEKYYDGFGCKAFDMNYHISTLQSNTGIRTLILGILLCQSAVIFFAFGFLNMRGSESSRGVFFFSVILLAIIGVSLFLTIWMMIIANKSYKYLSNYQQTCNFDYSASFMAYSASSMEIKIMNDTIRPFIFGIILFFTLGLTSMLILFSMFGLCCCRVDKEIPDARKSLN